MKLFKQFIREQEGQDGVEYALLIGFVSALIVASAGQFTAAFDGFWAAGTTVIGNGTGNMEKIGAAGS